MGRITSATIARIAGNLMSGHMAVAPSAATDYQLAVDRQAVVRAVELARAIVAEVERTEPPEPKPKYEMEVVRSEVDGT